MSYFFFSFYSPGSGSGSAPCEDGEKATDEQPSDQIVTHEEPVEDVEEEPELPREIEDITSSTQQSARRKREVRYIYISTDVNFTGLVYSNIFGFQLPPSE